MKAVAVQQALERLQRAERAVEALAAAATVEEAEGAWSEFLIAASTIYSKLEQGAKGSNQSEAWYGRKKRERKVDPLLRYLHFARNSDEHGIERITGDSPPNDQLPDGRKLRFNERVTFQIQVYDHETHLPKGEPQDALLAGPSLEPVRVYDRRFGDHCDPPKMHLGAPLKWSGNFVQEIAVAGLAYLTSLVAEASGLPA